jgi:hypothetical protein
MFAGLSGKSAASLAIARLAGDNAPAVRMGTYHVPIPQKAKLPSRQKVSSKGRPYRLVNLANPGASGHRT